MGALKDMWPSGDSRFIDLPGFGNTHYIAAGQGAPVVLLHGLGASIVTWAYNIRPLAERYAVYAVDLPGHGDSAKPDSSYNLEEGVAFLSTFLKALRLEGAALIGNSMGGLLALATAERHRELTRALVLVDSAGLGRELAWPLRIGALPVVGPAMEYLAVKNRRRLMRLVFHHPDRIAPHIYAELFRIRKLAGSSRTMVRALRNGVNLLGLRPHLRLLHDILADLPIPTLLIWGEEDVIIPVTHARQAAWRYPDLDLCVIPDTGHWPHMEQPQEFNNRVMAFLDQNAAGDAGDGAT
jgi:pimeloyl-ACP methyl ester carboxylesterase